MAEPVCINTYISFDSANCRFLGQTPAVSSNFISSPVRILSVLDAECSVPGDLKLWSNAACFQYFSRIGKKV